MTARRADTERALEENTKPVDLTVDGFCMSRGRGNAHLRLGARAEAIVAEQLERQGYTILARNLRVGRAEIDIVAERGRTLVFVEVRARKHANAVHPLETIDAAKIRRIRRAALQWVIEQKMRRRALRFDAAAVTFERPDGVVDYREGAF